MSLGSGAAVAGDLPDAAQVATRLGKDVEFADVIKAVSMAAGFDRLMQHYPESRWLKNSYAQFAFQARDRPWPRSRPIPIWASG